MRSSSVRLEDIFEVDSPPACRQTIDLDLPGLVFSELGETRRIPLSVPNS